MNIAQIEQVMQKYGKAWEGQDTSLLLDCFTENGVYQESPLARPYKGHKEIGPFWNQVVVQETKNISFTLKHCYVSSDEKVGFAEWECTSENKCNNWKKARAVGVMILQMQDEKIASLNEYWNTEILSQ